jgi:NAD(P)H-quinone oxidoreductase subunit 5
METLDSPLVFGGAFAATLVPLLWLAGALLPGNAKTGFGLGFVGASTLVLALAAAAASVAVPAAAIAPDAWVRHDLVSRGMLALITLLGWILVRFSTVYLEGDPGRGRFLRWMAATLASVSTLVVANHLVVFGAAWIATSVCLHKLLVFYADRPMAQLAAHKKFLVSRTAEMLLVAGFVFLASTYDSLWLGEILAAAQGQPLPATASTALVLLALAAILKCAQLPFHGWLIQVMETPTPVSALLHAGIINLGGFLLISFAPLLDAADGARWLLVAVGGTTAAIAGLITMTRVSVKVGLAWSTCAQMGFMLLECGLGLYELALLHLFAHSLYKAHAFLSAGRTVTATVERHWAHLPQVHRVGGWLAATAAGLAIALGTSAALGLWAHATPALGATLWILGLGLGTILGEALARRRSGLMARAAVTAVALGLLYGLWHQLFAAWIPAGALSAAALGPAVLSAVLLTVPYIAYVSLRVGPPRFLRETVYAYLYHGLYLDDAFTRLVFSLWPPKAGESRAAVDVVPASSTAS